MSNRKVNRGNIRILSFNQTASGYSLLRVYIWKTNTTLLSVCCLLTCSLEKCSHKLTSVEKLKWESINLWYIIMVINRHIHPGWVQIMSHCVSLILHAVWVSHLTQKPQCPSWGHGEATSMLKMLTERAYSDISSQEPTTYMITVPKVISVLHIQVLYSPLWAPPRATCS